MTMDELIKHIRTHLNEYLPANLRPCDINICPSLSRVGGTDLYIRPETPEHERKSIIYPVIHLDDIIDQRLNPHEALRAIAEICTARIQEAPVGLGDILTDFDIARDHIHRRIYSRETRPEIESWAVSEPIAETDLFETYCISISHILRGRMNMFETDDQVYNVTITPHILDSWGVTITDLRSAAESNDERDGLDVITICDMINTILDDNGQGDVTVTDDAQIPLLVVTNRMKNYGAAAFLHRSVRERLAGKYGMGYYVLPSSVHETMVMPADTEFDPSDLRQIVAEINEEIVAAEDKLSDHCYLVRSDGTISIAA